MVYLGARDQDVRESMAQRAVEEGRMTPEQASEQYSVPNRPVTVERIEQRIDAAKPKVYNSGGRKTTEGFFNVGQSLRQEQQRQTLPQQVATNLLKKTGFSVKQNGEIITATKNNTKVTIAPNGSLITPRSAKVNTNFISSFNNQIRKELVRKEIKKQELTQAIKNLRADLAELSMSVRPADKNLIQKFINKTKIPKLKTYSNKVLVKEYKRAEKLKQQLQNKLNKAYTPTKKGKSPPGQLKTTLYVQTGLASAGAMRGLIGVGTLVTNPIKSAKSAIKSFSSVSEAKRTAKTMLTQFNSDPVGTMVEFYVFGKGLKLLGTGMKATPLARIVQEEMFLRFKVPKQLRSSVRIILKAERKQRGISPIAIGKIKKVDFIDVKTITKVEAVALKKTLQSTDSIVFGSKASRLTGGKRLPIPKDVDIATSNIDLFNKTFIRNLPKSYRKNILSRGQKVYRKLSSNESRLYNAHDLIKVNGKTYLTIADVKPLSRLIPNKNILGRGSLPISGIGKKVSIFKPSKSSLNTLKNEIKSTIRKLRSSKPKTKIQKEYIQKQLKNLKKTLKLANKKGLKSQKIVQLINKKGYFPSIVPPYTKKGLATLDLGIKTGKIVKIEGIKFTGFSEQTTRKALGTLQVLIEKNARRAKDPQSLLIALETQLRVLKKTKAFTPFGRIRIRGKIKAIDNAVKLMKTKKFARLLNKSVKGLTKEYPLVAKINVKRLRKIKPKLAKQIAKRKAIPKIKGILAKNAKRLTPSGKLRRKTSLRRISLRSKTSQGRKSSKIPSKKYRPSKLPKYKPSRLPSNLPSRLKNALSKLKPSKLTNYKASKIISKINKSKLPPNTKSQLKNFVKSKLPRIRQSRLPGNKPSKIPSLKMKPSKIPEYKMPKIKIPKIILSNNIKKLQKKYIKKALKGRKFIFLPDLAAKLRGERAKGKEIAQLLRKGRIFTGLEARRIVRR